STGDDGIHGDADVEIDGGAINIDKSQEGIEGKNITIADGTILVNAADDGVNNNGGSSEFGMPGMVMSAAGD
ncbi:carbohydrate-binding domain-containing protein, partial [Shouchella clausii]|uniref:carbohydrate-binding domain-containing protein n=1 Tax=Shouchella clausii TaxID=79880 RepID=UPI001160D20B